MRYLLFILFGYLCGSVLNGYLLPLWIRHVDVTENSPDHNPGAANVFLCAGIPLGVLVILLELAKGAVPVYWATRVLDVHALPFALVLAAPVLGHACPFWRPHGGGKAIAVSFGALLGLLPEFHPLALLVFFYLLFSLVIRIQPHFFRSIITYLCFAAAALYFVPGPALPVGCLLIAGIVIGAHLARYQGERPWIATRLFHHSR